MMAAGPSARAPSALTWPAPSPFAFPNVTLNVLPSMKTLSRSARMPGAFCDCAAAGIADPDAVMRTAPIKEYNVALKLCIDSSLSSALEECGRHRAADQFLAGYAASCVNFLIHINSVTGFPPAPETIGVVWSFGHRFTRDWESARRHCQDQVSVPQPKISGGGMQLAKLI
jgi:hypothetical protein